MRRADVERFDRWADTYDRSFLQQRVFDPVHRAMMEALGPLGEERVLEVGCGTGTLTMALSERARHAIGVDPAPRMVAIAARKARGRSASFAVASAEELPFEDNAFGGAVASMTLHHWADAGQGLAELARVLRPGGTLAIADIDLPSPARWVLRRLGQSHAGWSRRELADFLYGAGFVAVRSTSRGPISPKLPILVATR